MLAKKVQQQFRRKLIIDLNHEYGGTVFFDFDSLAEYAEQFIDKPDSEFNLVLRPTTFEADIDVDYTCKLAYLLSNCLVVLEEAEMWLSTNSMPDSVYHLIAFGRHKQVSLMGIAPSVPEIAKELRRQFTSFVTFHQTEPSDIELLVDYGFNEETIRGLEGHQWAFIGEDPFQL